MSDSTNLHDSIISGDAAKSHSITEEALAEGVMPLDLINKFMSPAMDEVGRRFESGEYFVPELLLSARAMKSSMKILRPLLIQGGTASRGKVAIGTVKGDLHDIGKNLVAAMLEGGGFEVFDLGVNVSPEKFIATVQEENIDIVAMSALLTTTMPSMRLTIEEFEKAGLREKVKVLVGGAPVTQTYANEIEADGYSGNAVGAVQIAKEITLNSQRDNP